MELPFLKNKKKQGGGTSMAGTYEPSEDGAHLRRQVVREMFDAIERKDEEAFCSAFEALVLNIKDADEEQE